MEFQEKVDMVYSPIITKRRCDRRGFPLSSIFLSLSMRKSNSSRTCPYREASEYFRRRSIGDGSLWSAEEELPLWNFLRPSTCSDCQRLSERPSEQRRSSSLGFLFQPFFWWRHQKFDICLLESSLRHQFFLFTLFRGFSFFLFPLLLPVAIASLCPAESHATSFTGSRWTSTDSSCISHVSHTYKVLGELSKNGNCK